MSTPVLSLPPAVRVFVSSTWLDLQAERKAVEIALQRFRETKFVGMEYFGSRDESPSPASLAEIDRCHVYVGIIGGRYGSGITQREYRRAGELDLPRFIYLKKDSELRDQMLDVQARLTEFLDEVSRHTTTAFSSPDDLAARVTADLHRWLFDEYVTPQLDRALQVGAPRAEVEALLAAVKDAASLGRDLWGRLGKAGFATPVQEVRVLTAAEVEDRNNLGVLRDRVKQWWISGVLEKSVHGEALLALGKEDVPGAVSHPWETVLEVADQRAQGCPPDTAIAEIFDQVGGFLLVLGEPGSGKTITLLELARDLITAAADDPSRPVPVVLNLSSWAAQRQALEGWIVEELKLKYYVAKSTATEWLEKGRLLPLLDGLDEVATEHRRACAEAINTFVREAPPPGLVVCCRREEYESVGAKLALRAAISIQTMTLQQADAYLAARGGQLAGLRQAFRDDPALQEMARSPLMLSVMALAYQDTPATALARSGTQTIDARRADVFRTYVDRMFTRRGTTAAFEKARTEAWLSSLAIQLERHSQTIFTLEQLQPSWCSSRRQQWAYMLSTRVVAGVALGLAIFLTGAPPREWLWWLALGVGVGMGLLVAHVDILRLTFGRPVGVRRSSVAVTGLCYFFALFLSATLVWALVNALATWIEVGWLGVYGKTILRSSLLYSFYSALLLMITFGRRIGQQGLDGDIEIAEALRWSWRNARRGAAVGSLAGISIVLFVFVIEISLGEEVGIRVFGRLWQNSRVIVFWVLILALSGGMLGGIAVRSGVGPIAGSVPNQRIRMAGRRALICGGIGGSAVFLATAALSVVLWGMGQLQQAARQELFWGLAASLVVALRYGGFDISKHYVLRVLLYRGGVTPRRLVGFLDYAAQLVLLQKVGSGYVFIHRLFLEYFAHLPEKRREGTGAA